MKKNVKLILGVVSLSFILFGCTLNYEPTNEGSVYKDIKDGQTITLSDTEIKEFLASQLHDVYTINRTVTPTPQFKSDDSLKLVAALKIDGDKIINYEKEGKEVPRELAVEYAILKDYSYHIGERKLSDIDTSKPSAYSISNDLLTEYLNFKIDEFKGMTFEVRDNGISITGYTGTEKDIVIPNEVGGVPIIRIGGGAFDKLGLNSVVLPDNLQQIGISAFSYNNLTELKLPETLTFIDLNAFENNKIEKLVIPSKVTSIGSVAFFSNKISELTLPDSLRGLGNNTFQNNPFTEVSIPKGLSYEKSSFNSGVKIVER